MLIFLVVVACVTVYGQDKDEYKRMVDTAIILQTRNPEQTPYEVGIYLIKKIRHIIFLWIMKKISSIL